MEETPVTVVIPHYTAEILVDCLAALQRYSPAAIRVIVVADCPQAPSVAAAQEAFPQVEFLPNPRRLGFSGSCARGLAAVQTPYAVLLNDDTLVTQDWLPPLLACVQADPQVAACQAKLLSPAKAGRFDDGGAAGGYIDALGFPFCRGRLFDQVEQDQGQYDGPATLFWACGSAMFLRMEAVREVGSLDLDYFLHMEEIDLCWRLQLAGYRVEAVPASVVYHHSGFSMRPDTFARNYLKHRNNLIMICKNMDAGRLAWVLPVRLLLELLASVGYLLKRQWPSVPAPLAGLAWCLTHPRNIWRRRRQSRALRRSPVCLRGVYRGSIVFQYFVRGVRTAGPLMPEGAGR
ncbi:MAG: glycosyltransferase [Candidatus Latescibacteria bacterium]|nr:glycosyltransferase [Candidatus Latescibacterota bacterium]